MERPSRRKTKNATKNKKKEKTKKQPHCNELTNKQKQTMVHSEKEFKMRLAIIKQ